MGGVLMRGDVLQGHDQCTVQSEISCTVHTILQQRRLYKWTGGGQFDSGGGKHGCIFRGGK